MDRENDTSGAGVMAVMAAIFGFSLAGVMGRGTGVSIAVAITGAVAAYFVTLMIRESILLPVKCFYHMHDRRFSEVLLNGHKLNVVYLTTLCQYSDLMSKRVPIFSVFSEPTIQNQLALLLLLT